MPTTAPLQPPLQPHYSPTAASSSRGPPVAVGRRYDSVGVLTLTDAEDVMGGFEDADDGEYIRSLLDTKVRAREREREGEGGRGRERERASERERESESE
eukprot:5312362-Prymnesium_polylepis.1